ncbi:phosphonopyruvate decarboxylase [Pseudomonas stutzeri]|uniref:Phosphonopyruvate decarboxylase n=1 Tax=Stutzerimonas stutzeri TaxID=316 RepID=A0A2N8RZG8_STUST|nr:phosphonopyruvate decarboxylase [Stutzerimonas stutzeri]MCQ4295083.1 phosphonopyruvate decarboxylase [Stutzerimonas stutzeri]PNF79751.1 phosphonopyruvate decarboxylase [Stutzerimonas stutzeri]
MIDSRDFYRKLKEFDVSLFAGVPDSLLKDFCAYIEDHAQVGEHVITANEGNAVAIAAGYHLTSGKLAAVYMQNSGLGNAINPLVSIADSQVYRIPLVLIIGWRGEPGVKDEPQHVKQGEITPQQLDVLGIPYWILDQYTDLDITLKSAMQKLKAAGAPIAILVRNGTFIKYESQRKPESISQMKREDALRCLLSLIGDALVISTTGKTSRELFELRVEHGEAQRDFLSVGAMGHTASIALGAALGNPDKQIVCIDGDGSVLMHMGALPIIGDLAPRNLVHVLLNNAAHESVGGQPTVGGKTDFKSIAFASGYKDYKAASDAVGITAAWRAIQNQPGPVLFEIKIAIGSRDDLGRPTSTPQENKRAFMQAAGL